MNTLITYASNYLLPVILLLIILIPARIINSKALKKSGKKTTALREAAVIFLSIYTYIMSIVMIQPYWEVSFYDEYRMMKMADNSFVPFEKLISAISGIIGGSFSPIGELIKPILIFIPIGFLLALCWRIFEEKLWVTALVSLGIGLIIQLPQYWTCRGADIDDAILFAVGAFLGVLIFRFIDKFAKNKSKFRICEHN